MGFWDEDLDCGWLNGWDEAEWGQHYHTPVLPRTPPIRGAEGALGPADLLMTEGGKPAARST